MTTATLDADIRTPDVGPLLDIQKRADRLRDTVAGQRRAFPADAVPGQCIRQGDLYLTLAENPPEDYVRVPDAELQDTSGIKHRNHLQLVLGSTRGSRHELNSSSGIEMFIPKDGLKDEMLVGPFFYARNGATVEHPEHGHVDIPAGKGVQVTYQRVYDAELAAARRQLD